MPPQVRQAAADPDRVLVVSTSPSVRAALGEEFGMEPGAFVEGKMVALPRALGADYVLDTNFAADLTIVEEASELIRRQELHGAADHLGIPGLRDTDQVITTRELARWAKAEGVDWTALQDSAYDSLMGQASGAGVIFGNTGGVMEAALRTAYAYLTGESAPLSLLNLTPVRGYEGVREAQVEIGDQTLHAGCGRDPQAAHRCPLPAGRFHGAAHQP